MVLALVGCRHEAATALEPWTTNMSAVVPVLRANELAAKTAGAAMSAGLVHEFEGQARAIAARNAARQRAASR